MTPLRPPTRPLPEPLPGHLWTWKHDDWMVRVFHRHPRRLPLRARTFGPLHRFDPHLRGRDQHPREQADGRGAIYLAGDLSCGLAEALPQSPEVQLCPNRLAVLAAPRDDATLLDLSGDGAMHIGAVGTLGAGNEPRRMTQRWACAVYEDHPTVQGIRYRAAHQGGVAVAAWERAGPLRAMPGTSVPGHALSGALLTRVTATLAAQGRVPVVVSAAECQDCQAAGLV